MSDILLGHKLCYTQDTDAHLGFGVDVVGAVESGVQSAAGDWQIPGSTHHT